MCGAAAAVSYVTREALQRRYPTSGWQIGCSDAALDDAAFATAADVRRRLLARDGCGTATRPWRLVCVASLAQPYKGHDVLLDAVGALHATGFGVHLTIVGEGRLRTSLEARAAKLGLAASVVFTGQLPSGSAVRAVLDDADLFVLPSRTEGLPRALVEAMARGLPCLGTSVGGIPELLLPTHLVPPGDAAALARGVRMVLGTTEGRLTAALRNLQAARSYHDDELRPRRLAFLHALRDAARTRRAATA
jgi:glycosyltransferase involved in cell wall biosynthesis